MLKIILIILPIFIVIALGNVLKSTRLIDDNFINTANKLLMYVFIPVLLFYKIAGSNFQEIFSLPHILILMGSIIAIFIFSLLLAQLMHLSAPVRGSFVSTSFRANSAFIGLPICYYVFGDQGVAIASILIAFLIPLNNILGILIFSLADFKLSNLGSFFIKMFSNPIILGCLVGIVFSVFSLPIPEFVDNTLDIISGITMPLALINIGANISIEYLKGNTRLLIIGIIIKLFGLPGLAYLCFRIWGITSFSILEMAVIVLLGCPSAQINYLLASVWKGDPDLAIGGIISTTFLSAFSIVFWLFILHMPI
jgi:predicted permease